MNLQNIKDRRADQPANKTCDALSHPHVALVELQWLETIEKMYVYGRHFLHCYRVHYVNGSTDFVVLTKVIFKHKHTIYTGCFTICGHYCRR